MMDRFKIWISSNYIILLILLLATILRVYHIDYQSIWLDEICSINEANPNINWSDLEDTVVVSDPHPLLYFVLLKFSFISFGYTSFVARCLSAFIGIVGVLAFYNLGKKLFNKKTGLIAAFLLAINVFHIYYSQEVRMYSLLFLFTVLSFNWLLIFIKNKTFKNAILYGFFTGLMLETQFFALFILLSQLVVLLIDFLKTQKEHKKDYVLKCVISGLIMTFIFLPALHIFIETTKKKYTAIPPISLDIILQIFIDFVQNSYYLLVIFISIICFNIVKYFKNSEAKQKYKITNIILLSWFFITLAIPIIRSYLVTPMIVSRYFIAILPVILLFVAFGIYQIKTNIYKVFILILITCFTFYQSIIIDDYYNKVVKTQFRETTKFIIANNKTNDEVVSGLNWYLVYFFKDNQEIKITRGFLENHIIRMMNGERAIESFWYFGAFGDYFNLSDEHANFIKTNFILVNSIDKYDCWAKHYVKISDSKVSKNKLSGVSIKLSNISDNNWLRGVGVNYNMLLVDYSIENENILKSASGLKLKNNKILKIIGYEKIGNYLHVHLQKNVYNLKEVIAYPITIEVIKYD